MTSVAQLGGWADDINEGMRGRRERDKMYT